MNKNSMINVPFIAYEKEMDHKNTIVKIMGAIILFLVVAIVCIVYMFMSFIGNYDYKNYDQNGEGVNNINSGQQGDVINESDITTTN